MSKWRFVILNVPRGRGLQKKNIRKNYQGEKLKKVYKKKTLLLPIVHSINFNFS